jgi:hypothetical protein
VIRLAAAIDAMAGWTSEQLAILRVHSNHTPAQVKLRGNQQPLAITYWKRNF